MTEGEKIILLRAHARDLAVLEARLATLENVVYEMKEILKSPIRRETYAARQK